MPCCKREFNVVFHTVKLLPFCIRQKIIACFQFKTITALTQPHNDLHANRNHTAKNRKNFTFLNNHTYYVLTVLQRNPIGVNGHRMVHAAFLAVGDITRVIARVCLLNTAQAVEALNACVTAKTPIGRPRFAQTKQVSSLAGD